jgi:hypothetical protein
LASYGSSSKRLAKQIGNIVGFPIRREKRNDHSMRGAPLAAQAILYLDERIGIAKMLKLHERLPRMVLAFAAIRAVIVAINDVNEGCRLELCVFRAYDQQKFTMNQLAEHVVGFRE